MGLLPELVSVTSLSHKLSGGIGVLWGDEDRYSISVNKFERFGSRERVSLAR
jgi:hypothetical protein